MNDNTLMRWPFFAGLVLLAITLALFVVVQPFWKPIFWAVVFTILFWPLRTKWAAQMKGGATTATIAILLVILFFVLLPTLFLLGLIADGAAVVVTSVRDSEFQAEAFYDTLQTRFPWFFDWLAGLGVTWGSIQSFTQTAVVNLGEFAMGQMANLATGASAFGFQLFIFFYLAFAFLQKGDRIYGAVFKSIPMNPAHKDQFFASFANMSTATIKGTVAVGLVQGTMGALAFAVLGIPGPFFWGALMALLSIIPPFGAGFIWAPAAVFLLLSGDVVGGIGLLVWGSVFISMSDNFVRPAIVGRSTSMPDYMVLIATLGGLSTFGLTGLVLGPVVGALFLTGWQVNTRDDPDLANGPAPTHGG